MPEEYFDPLDEEVQQASSGGGLICQVAVYGAYQVYASLSPAERIFLYGGDGLAKGDAKAKAETLAESNGSRVEQTLCTVQYKDSVLGRDVSHWKGDQYHTYGPFWGPDAKAFNERRKALGLKAGTKTWVRLGSIVSPNAEENQDKKWAWEDDREGNKQLKRLRLPVAVFSSKADAEEAAASLGATTANGEEVKDPTWPGHFDPSTTWTPSDWREYGFPEVKSRIGKTPVPVIAKEVDAPLEAVKLAMAEIEQT